MKGKNLIMCGLCACIGFIGGEVRAYHKVLNELRTTKMNLRKRRSFDATMVTPMNFPKL